MDKTATATYKGLELTGTQVAGDTYMVTLPGPEGYTGWYNYLDLAEDGITWEADLNLWLPYAVPSGSTLEESSPKRF